jgi:thioredoxin 1
MKHLLFVCLIVTGSLGVFSQNNAKDTLKVYPVNMTVDEFKERTSVKNKIILVNFSADWCVMCKKQKPILDQVKAEKKEVIDLIIIDMDENPLIAEYFNVDGLPINLMYKNGNLLWDRAGLKTKNELLKQIGFFE